ncbi:MAG TPA: hypothetical protein VFP43_23030, partial [Mesorhizobium sp.]|nr:hypothetical protein [Mesorhizobium sp.]
AKAQRRQVRRGKKKILRNVFHPNSPTFVSFAPLREIFRVAVAAPLSRKFKPPFFLAPAISPGLGVVNSLLLDENLVVASAGSGGAAVGGARSVPDHAVGSRWQPVFGSSNCLE